MFPFHSKYNVYSAVLKLKVETPIESIVLGTPAEAVKVPFLDSIPNCWTMNDEDRTSVLTPTALIVVIPTSPLDVIPQVPPTLTPPPPVALIVATPPAIDALILVPKFIVAAVPTGDPSSWITTPDPVATTPVNPEPSPIN